PGADAPQDCLFLVADGGREQYGHRAPDGLFRRIAVQALGTPVPARDSAVEVLADDGVVRRIDDGRQPRPGLVRPGEVHHHVEAAGDPALAVAQGRGIDGTAAALSVGAFDEDLPAADGPAFAER